MYRRRVHLQEICTPCRMTENCRTKRPAAHARLGSHVDNPPWPSVGMQSMQHSSICDNVTRAYALCIIIIPFLFLLLLLLPVAFRFHLCHPRSTSKCRLCSEFKWVLSATRPQSSSSGPGKWAYSNRIAVRIRMYIFILNFRFSVISFADAFCSALHHNAVCIFQRRSVVCCVSVCSCKVLLLRSPSLLLCMRIHFWALLCSCCSESARNHRAHSRN